MYISKCKISLTKDIKTQWINHLFLKSELLTFLLCQGTCLSLISSFNSIFLSEWEILQYYNIVHPYCLSQVFQKSYTLVKAIFADVVVCFVFSKREPES